MNDIVVKENARYVVDYSDWLIIIIQTVRDLDFIEPFLEVRVTG